MNKQILYKLIKEFQEKNSKEAQNLLLQSYYDEACKWACKCLAKNTYSNLISYEISEIKSFVFLSFWKALKKYKIKSRKKVSFKNYFLQTIKYQMYCEMKKTFNWRVISNYKASCSMLLYERKNDLEAQEEYLEKSDISLKCEIILEFLMSKNALYAKIFKLKSIGYKNKEICEKLGLTDEEIKWKYQYIKKLILAQFSKIENIC